VVVWGLAIAAVASLIASPEFSTFPNAEASETCALSKRDKSTVPVMQTDRFCNAALPVNLREMSSKKSTGVMSVFLLILTVREELLP